MIIIIIIITIIITIIIINKFLRVQTGQIRVLLIIILFLKRLQDKETEFFAQKIYNSDLVSVNQKKPQTGVLRKRCSENMQQICRRPPMPKCDFNKDALYTKDHLWRAGFGKSFIYSKYLNLLFFSLNLYVVSYLLLLLKRFHNNHEADENSDCAQKNSGILIKISENKEYRFSIRRIVS